MKAYTYLDKGRFAFMEKPEPRILDPKDAIVKVTLASICTSDLHIKHGYVNNCQSPGGEMYTFNADGPMYEIVAMADSDVYMFRINKPRLKTEVFPHQSH